MRPAGGGAILGCLVLAIACPRLWADGGSLRLSAVCVGYRISVFTAPTPLRKGPVDISVLVQDRATGEPMPSARVSVCVTKPGQSALTNPATFEAATNKLFRAAQFDFPASGRWEMQVQVDGAHGHATIGGDLDVEEALPQWHELWLWIGWPAGAITLFGIHQGLVRRKLGRRIAKKKPPE
jgi:hypothetical protein